MFPSDYNNNELVRYKIIKFHLLLSAHSLSTAFQPFTLKRTRNVVFLEVRVVVVVVLSV